MPACLRRAVSALASGAAFSPTGFIVPFLEPRGLSPNRWILLAGVRGGGQQKDGSWRCNSTYPVPSQANLPLLQRELLHCARMAKQTPAQYLAQHEQLLLDANASSPIDSSELLLEVNETGKRRTPDR